MSKVLKYLSYHKGEIFTGISLVAGAGAVVASFIEAPKARQHLRENRETFKTNRVRIPEGKTDPEKFKRSELVKHVGKTTKDFAWDMKGTIICEAVSIGFGIAGCCEMRKAVKAASMAAASAASMLAMTEAAVKDVYGEEGFKKIAERRKSPIKISERRVNPVSGKVEDHEYTMDPPEEIILDQHVKDIVDQLPLEARAGIDLAHCVLIDNEVFAYRSTNGNIDVLAPTLKNAFLMMNKEMQIEKGEMTMRRELEILGFMDTYDSKRFNQTILKVAGTIDTPTAKDMVSGKTIRIKGFDLDGNATDRYGEYTHKQLSFGEDQDRWLFGSIEERDVNPWFIIDGKILLNLSYDGNTAELIPENVTVERKRSAWVENPEYEK